MVPELEWRRENVHLCEHSANFEPRKFRCGEKLDALHLREQSPAVNVPKIELFALIYGFHRASAKNNCANAKRYARIRAIPN